MPNKDQLLREVSRVIAKENQRRKVDTTMTKLSINQVIDESSVASLISLMKLNVKLSTEIKAELASLNAKIDAGINVNVL